MLAEVSLTPAEGKRLIAKAIAQMDLIQIAKEEGIVVIATGTTNAYVVEELLEKEIKEKGLYTAGVVTENGLNITDPKSRLDPYVIEKGKSKTVKNSELCEYAAKMGLNDVFIKGANAIDPFGAAGILLNGVGGGTIGSVWGHLTANGVTTIIPAGLEKLVPISLDSIVPRIGKTKIDVSLNLKCGMMVIQGVVITEMEAFKELFGVEVIPIGGGGIEGAEGCKIFLIDGPDEAVESALKLVKKIKGEPKLHTKISK
ncbi:hypothetical protein JW865_08510 [Candidatus Bathyarchaeota archaeon]|nr:hypothetical protein [Candidatus Bathyarchaeota archaeon]